MSTDVGRASGELVNAAAFFRFPPRPDDIHAALAEHHELAIRIGTVRLSSSRPVWTTRTAIALLEHDTR